MGGAVTWRKEPKKINKQGKRKQCIFFHCVIMDPPARKRKRGPRRLVGQEEIDYARSLLRPKYRDCISEETIARFLRWTTIDLRLQDKDTCNPCNASLSTKRKDGLTKGHLHRSIGVGGRRVMAHRLFYNLFNGDIPEGAFVLHTCHETDGACVNYHHLKIGDAIENMRDCMAAGNFKPRGMTWQR